MGRVLIENDGHLPNELNKNVGNKGSSIDILIINAWSAFECESVVVCYNMCFPFGAFSNN